MQSVNELEFNYRDRLPTYASQPTLTDQSHAGMKFDCRLSMYLSTQSHNGNQTINTAPIAIRTADSIPPNFRSAAPVKGTELACGLGGTVPTLALVVDVA